MFRNKKFLSGLALIVAFAIGAYAADGTIWTLTGNGSRRNTVEWTVESPTVGTAAHLLPGTNAANNIGSATQQPQNLWIDGTANIDTLNINNFNIFSASDTLSVDATGTTYSLTHTYTIISASAAITVNTVPLISTTSVSAGTLLILRNGGSNTITIRDDGALAASGFALGASSRALGTNDTIVLILDDETSANWVELSFVNIQ